MHKSMKRRLIASHRFNIYLILFPFVATAKEEDFGLIRPSLIRQLRAILDQYPDDGQILKVRSIFVHRVPTRPGKPGKIMEFCHSGKVGTLKRGNDITLEKVLEWAGGVMLRNISSIEYLAPTV